MLLLCAMNSALPKSPDVIARLKRQIETGGLPRYLETAIEFGHGVGIELRVRADGKLRSPILRIDTSDPTRGATGRDYRRERQGT